MTKYDIPKWILIHTNSNVINKLFVESGTAVYPPMNQQVTQIEFDTETELNTYILDNELTPKFEFEDWDFDNKYRVIIPKDKLILNSELTSLVQYAISNGIAYKKYTYEYVIYVEFFYQSHYNIFTDNDLTIEKNEGVNEIDIRD